MKDLLDPARIEAARHAVESWLFDSFLVWNTLTQASIILGACLLAHLIGSRVKTSLRVYAEQPDHDSRLQMIANAVAPLSFHIVWLVLQWLSVVVVARAGGDGSFINFVVSLLSAWVVIRLASTWLKNTAWANTLSIVAWGVAALNIVGLLNPTIELLDSLAITLGTLRVSALIVLKGILVLAVFLWLASVASRVLERRIHKEANLTPSVQVLFSKLLKIVLITLAVVGALTSVGVDLTAFAVLSGAIGLGIGFGLQKVISNFVSGIILLLDKSIKPGDVIAIGDTYGWITSLGARYVSIDTRDGIEHLIPNEDLITTRVENWSFSNSLIRLKLSIGVSYRADVRKAISLCLEAATETDRILKDPAPICLLAGFGDSSVDLQLRMWINDPANGLSNVKSQVLLKVWDKFHENDIEIPFPQRDLHLKSAGELQIRLSDRPE